MMLRIGILCCIAFVFSSYANQLYGQEQIETFGHKNAEWAWGLKGKQKSLNDDELVKLSFKEIEKLSLYEKNEKSGRGDVYWVGGKLYFDNDGSIFNGRNESSPNQLDKPRFLEVIDTADKKVIRLMRISSQKGRYNFYIVKEFLVKGVAKPPKAEPLERVKTAPSPSVQSATPLKEDKISPTPLQKYDISQLELVAIITTPGGNKGLVEDSAGKGYFVEKGTLIGKNDGRVSKVLKDRVIIEELYSDSSGQRKVSEISLVLPQLKEERRAYKDKTQADIPIVVNKEREKGRSFEGTVSGFLVEARGYLDSPELKISAMAIQLIEYKNIDFYIESQKAQKWDLTSGQKVQLKCVRIKSPNPNRDAYLVLDCQTPDQRRRLNLE